MPKTTEQRFFEKVNKDGPNGCWEWTASLTHNYGIFTIKSKSFRAHRWSYEYHKGEIPYGMLVCHSCDNPRCVNPDHLWLVTNKENTLDAKEKGRLACGDYNGARKNKNKINRGEKHHNHLNPEKLARGSSNGNSKLTEQSVMEARKEFQCGISVVDLAKKYKISWDAMHQAINKKTWKHVI